MLSAQGVKGVRKDKEGRNHKNLGRNTINYLVKHKSFTGFYLFQKIQIDKCSRKAYGKRENNRGQVEGIKIFLHFLQENIKG